MMYRDCIFSCMCIFLRLHISCGQTYEEAVTLLRNKTFFYEKSIRPVKNQSTALNVHIHFDLVSILNFDEVQESLTVIGGVSLNWTDEFITWNPTDYGGMEDIVSESGNFWMPDLILINNVNKLEKLGESWQRIRFTNKGDAYVVQADTLSTICKADVKFYPWDSHWCEFEFSTVFYLPAEMSLRPVSDKVGTLYYIESGTWELKGSNVQIKYQNAVVLFRIHIARKPIFVLVNVVLPIIAMTFLNAAIFIIPVESGERISYSITVLLAIAVFLTLVGDNLPKTSTPMPVFSFYLLTVLILSMLITFANIFSLRLYHHDNPNPSNGMFATLTKYILHEKKVKKNAITIKVDRRPGLSVEPRIEKIAVKNKVDHSIDSMNAPDDGYRVSSEITWKEVSVAFDRVCFIVFNIVLMLAAFVFFIIVSNK